MANDWMPIDKDNPWHSFIEQRVDNLCERALAYSCPDCGALKGELCWILGQPVQTPCKKRLGRVS